MDNEDPDLKFGVQIPYFLGAKPIFGAFMKEKIDKEWEKIPAAITHKVIHDLAIKPLTRKEIKKICNNKENTLKSTLGRLKKSGLIRKHGNKFCFFTYESVDVEAQKIAEKLEGFFDEKGFIKKNKLVCKEMFDVAASELGLNSKIDEFEKGRNLFIKKRNLAWYPRNKKWYNPEDFSYGFVSKV